MDIQGWDERYKNASRPREDLEAPPTPLVVRTAKAAPAGDALDLACGAGRNALWLAEHGWRVTAVDGSAAAIDILRTRAQQRGLNVISRVADLTAGEYEIAPAAWDLIVIAYYLQRDLILGPGELVRHFQGWEILHDFEGAPEDPAHRRPVAEIAARRPKTS